MVVVWFDSASVDRVKRSGWQLHKGSDRGHLPVPLWRLSALFFVMSVGGVGSGERLAVVVALVVAATFVVSEVPFILYVQRSHQKRSTKNIKTLVVVFGWACAYVRNREENDVVSNFFCMARKNRKLEGNEGNDEENLWLNGQPTRRK